MIELRLLLLDDQIGDHPSSQRSFIQRFQDLNKRLPLDFRFHTGQIKTPSEVENSVDASIEFVDSNYIAGSTILLLDLNFDSGPLNQFGFPSGTASDINFGERIYEELIARCPALPVVFVTSKPQNETNYPDATYLNKGSVDSDSFIRCVLQANLLSIDLLRFVIGVPELHIFSSKSMGQCYATAYLHASTKSSILLSGESGVGKEFLAEFIHQSTGRAGRFVAVDVGTTPDSLVESEWFGIEKGTATGVEKRIGKFELASGGTLFLDEIADIDLPLQAKLLRVLQTRSVSRVGGREPASVDFKLVCATSRDLRSMVKNGLFREDLYYRIADVTITVSPLRDRPEDIRSLASHVIDSVSRELNISEVSLSPGAERHLMSAPLRGNVRELKSVLSRALAGMSSFGLISENNLEAHWGRERPNDVSGSALDIEHKVRQEGLEQFFSVILQLMDTSTAPKVASLWGISPKLDRMISRISRNLVRQALVASRNPVTSKFNKQRAAQLLVGHDKLAGQNPLRLINRMLGRKSSTPLTQKDCENLVNQPDEEVIS